MKKNLFIYIGLTITAMSYGQNGSEVVLQKDSITPPEFWVEKTGGFGSNIKTINDYLKSAVVYPDGAKRQRQMGTVVVEFVVTDNGGLKDYHVINSVSDELDQEVIRALEGTRGMWNPGLINGNPAPMKKEVSLVFMPDDGSDLVKVAKKYFNKGNEMLFTKENPKRALKYFNKAVALLPYEKDLLAVRSLCKYKLGDTQGAREDWERIINMELGDVSQLETGYLIIKTKQRDELKELEKLIDKE